MKKEATESKVYVRGRMTQEDIDKASPTPAVAKALAIEDRDKRADALHNLGFCWNAYGSCRLGPKNTVAHCDKKKDGTYKTECEGHLQIARDWSAKHRPKSEAKPKVAKATKKVTVLPTKKAVDNIKAALAASKTQRIAAGPAMPKDMK